MKKLFILLSLACMGLAVSSCYDDSELWESVNGLESRVKTLETLCSEMNTNISSLQDLAAAVQKGGYITEVTPLTENGVEVGYKVTLNDGRMVTIYHGKNGSAGGNAPQIGVKQDSDGKYYWVVGGEWIKDDKGNKVPVSSGTTPKIKVENGKWCVSYDGGTTWEELGAATASDTCLFDDVTYTNGVLTLKFADGNVLSFPIGDTFRIVLGDFDPNVGKNLEIPYTIQGATGEVMVFAVADNVYDDAEIMVKGIVEETAYSGKIKVRVSWEDEEYIGKVAIFAADESGTTVSKILKLTTGVMYAEDDKDYIIDAEGGQFSLKVTTNRTFKVNTNADWITYVETKAVEEKTLLFDVEANEGKARQTEIEVVSGDRTLVFPVTQRTGGDSVFSVNLQYNELSGGPTSFSLVNTMGSNGVMVSPPRNASGQTFLEYMGYDTWQEFADAVGDNVTACEFAGDVVITAYNVKTGESYGNVDYLSNYPSYCFTADGALIEEYYGDYMTQFYWYMGPMLSDMISFGLNRDKIIAGETYSFGIMVSSESAEALIEVNIEITEYIDPEAGLYDNPSAPGKYEFDIEDEVDIPDWDAIKGNWGVILEKCYRTRSDVWEKVKETLGMTSYEIYLHNSGLRTYYQFENGRKTEDYSYDCIFDADGELLALNNSNDTDSRSIHVVWRRGQLPSDYYLLLWIPYDSDDWCSGVLRAAENGTVIEYQYVIEFEGYELVFNHTIKFKWAESAE